MCLVYVGVHKAPQRDRIEGFWVFFGFFCFYFDMLGDFGSYGALLGPGPGPWALGLDHGPIYTYFLGFYFMFRMLL